MESIFLLFVRLLPAPYQSDTCNLCTRCHVSHAFVFASVVETKQCLDGNQSYNHNQFPMSRS